MALCRRVSTNRLCNILNALSIMQLLTTTPSYYVPAQPGHCSNRDASLVLLLHMHLRDCVHTHVHE